MSRLPSFVALLAVTIGGWNITATSAQEFRIESDVFLGKEKEPFAQHLTLFTDSLVYDFTLAGPNEITIFDPQRGEILLLDVAKQQQTKVAVAELLEITSKIRSLAEKNDASAVIVPEFEVDSGQDVIELKSKRVVYRAVGNRARQPNAAARYREFADHSARLNAMRPGNAPPFGRLELNRELSNKGLLPEKIERTIRTGGIFSKQSAHSEHLVYWQLSNTDRQRIQDVAGYLVSYRKVGLKQYLKGDRVAAK